MQMTKTMDNGGLHWCVTEACSHATMQPTINHCLVLLSCKL